MKGRFEKENENGLAGKQPFCVSIQKQQQEWEFKSN
jgi:hypothetical protein